MPAREQRRPPAYSPIIIPEYASSESSASPRDLSPLVSGASPVVTVPASPTTDQSISDATLSPPNYSMQGSDLAGDPEQQDYPVRPMTPRAEHDPDAGHAALYDSSSQTYCRVSIRTR